MKNFLDKLITKVNLQSPDMVVIVGDLIDTNPKDLKNYISKLNDFNSTYGTFYALGNHEYYHGINEVLDLLRKHTNMKNFSQSKFRFRFYKYCWTWRFSRT